MPRSKTVYQVQSLGGGVQSMTMYLLSVHGLLPKSDAAIFADTGWERHSTIENVNKLKEMDLGIPIHIVKNPRGTVREQALNPDYDFINMPVYNKSSNGTGGQAKRQCTTHYKLRPIRKAFNDIFGSAHFRQWIGISLDETLRMRTSDVKYIQNWYPLVEKVKFTRTDCIKWLEENGYGIRGKKATVCPRNRLA